MLSANALVKSTMPACCAAVAAEQNIAADNSPNHISAACVHQAAYFYSTAYICRMTHITHTSPTCRHHSRIRELNPTAAMPASQQYSRAQSNRRNEQQRLRRANRNSLLNSRRNSRRPSLDGTRGRRTEQQQNRRNNARQASLASTLAESGAYVRTPNLSTSISQFWELPPLRPECNEEQRAFTLDARNDIINTAQRAANIIVDIASPCGHCGAQLFKGECF